MGPRSRRSSWIWIAASLLCAATAFAEDAPPSITVTGSGQVAAPPDRAHVSAGVVSEAPRASDAIRANAAAMQKVMAALDQSGIDRKFVQTQRFDVSPVYADREPRVSGVPQVTGYRVSNAVLVEVRGVERVGPVIDALAAAGANEMGGISFGIAEPAPLLDEARKKAIADARRKAELYAREAGVALGRVLRIDEGGAPAPVPVAFARMEAAAATPVAPGQLELSTTVSVSWSLAP